MRMKLRKRKFLCRPSVPWKAKLMSPKDHRRMVKDLVASIVVRISPTGAVSKYMHE